MPALVIDEAAVVENVESFSVEVTHAASTVSDHLFSERKVIEISVSVSAKPVDKEWSEDVFVVRCTAGFVGRDPALDGDLERFKAVEDHYARFSTGWCVSVWTQYSP